MTQIVYEPHPLTPERKSELRAQGVQIIDARFKPQGEEPETPETPEQEIAPAANSSKRKPK